jgi:hypothetical protein
MNEQSYIKASKLNASNKRDLEMQLLNRKSSLLPVSFSDKPTYVYYNPDNYNLESNELVKEWIRDLRINGENNQTLVHNITEHDAFVTLFVLNNLRKAGIPNFLYYYGVVNFNNSFYALTEQVFNKEYKNWPSFTDICRTQSFEIIFEFYLSILLSIYMANHKFSYTHYGLSCDDILMKPVENTSFDVEYKFRSNTVYINNTNYIPLITSQEKSYVKINIDENDKSFGYNDIGEIPFESKGIYYDKDFAITDAYSLLHSILNVTKECNTVVYKKFQHLSKFFKEDNTDFLPYHEETKNIHLGDYIAFLILNNEARVKFESSNTILRCSGVQLEVKNGPTEYYKYKNMIQLYDYYHIYKNSRIDDIDGNIIKKEIIKYENMKERINSHTIIHQIPNIQLLINNKKYIDIITKNLVELIMYYNNFERVSTSLTITQSLSSNIIPIRELYTLYKELYNDNKEYYDAIIDHFITIRNITRENKTIYNSFISYILFLESIE